MPHPWPCAFTGQNKSFWAGQKILDLRTEVFQCSRLCADSFLRDKLNPLWERELQMPPNSTPKALQGSSSEGAREVQLGWQAGREPENRKRAPVPEEVSKRDFFQPDKWDTNGCLPDGITVLTSSPTLQLDRTATQTENMAKNPCYAFFQPQDE